MYCPMCGAPDHQMYIGKLGPDAVIRCGFCGTQYYRDIDDDPVLSMSEWGSYRYDGDTDMKVLRKRAEGAVRYFNNGRPRKEMETHVFGYPFSIIDNGKLADVDHAYKGNVIIRALSYGGGIYEGKTTLSYNDDYNDGRGQGGAGCVLIGDVKDVRIENGYLVISGLDRNKPIEYRYLIQERPDDKKVVFPIPKGGKVPPEKPVPKRQPTIEDFGHTPKPSPKTVPKAPVARKNLTVAEMIDGSVIEFCTLLEMLERRMERAGQWYYEPYDGRKIPVYTAAEMEIMLRDPVKGRELIDIFKDCYLTRYSEYWSYWKDFGITYQEFKLVQKRLRVMSQGYPPKPKTQTPSKPAEKPEPKPAPKPVPKPEPKKEAPKPIPKKPEPKKASKPVLRKKGEQVFEVRVDGTVMGSFSSKAKADSLKRQLKAEGKKAKIVGVFC